MTKYGCHSDSPLQTGGGILFYYSFRHLAESVVDFDFSS
jgi:hypothetical protein